MECAGGTGLVTDAQNLVLPADWLCQLPGYFQRPAAEKAAARLSEQGLDTYVGGAIAYSTLGWFADPLTTPMLQRSEPALAELLIHELAHRRLYIKNDTRFNESLATLVGREARWISCRHWHAVAGQFLAAS